MSGDKNPEQLHTMFEMFKNEFEAFNLSGMSPERRAKYDAELERLKKKQAKKVLRDLEFEEKKRELERETLRLTEELRTMHGNLNSIADFAFNNSGSPEMATIGPGTASAGPATATNHNGTNSYQGQPTQSQENDGFSVPETNQNGINSIIVESPGKPTLELLVPRSNTVADLKKLIIQKYKLNSNYRMDLYLGNDLLRDTKLLSELDVNDGTVFTCCLSL